MNILQIRVRLTFWNFVWRLLSVPTDKARYKAIAAQVDLQDLYDSLKIAGNTELI